MNANHNTCKSCIFEGASHFILFFNEILVINKQTNKNYLYVYPFQPPAQSKSQSAIELPNATVLYSRYNRNSLNLL